MWSGQTFMVSVVFLLTPKNSQSPPKSPFQKVSKGALPRWKQEFITHYSSVASQVSYITVEGLENLPRLSMRFWSPSQCNKYLQAYTQQLSVSVGKCISGEMMFRRWMVPLFRRTLTSRPLSNKSAWVEASVLSKIKTIAHSCGALMATMFSVL